MSSTAPSETYQIITPDFVEVSVATDGTKTSSLVVKKFQKDLTVWDLKQRLELITGRNANTMSITALSPEGELICKLVENYKLVGSYPLSNGVQLLVEDPMYEEADENEEDLDKRFQLSEEQYSNRRGTLKEFLKRNKLGKYNPEIIKEERKRAEAKDNEIINTVKIGQRCEVNIPNQVAKRGVVMFKGNVKFTEGLWVGVKYDEPFGKNDGTVNGVKYFEAPPNYGAFVKPSYVKVGDYPEITCDLECDDEF
ncbi:hypothetical protein PGB90_005577 [Kerria lacca]